jgi:hypothetical protein
MSGSRVGVLEGSTRHASQLSYGSERPGREDWHRNWLRGERGVSRLLPGQVRQWWAIRDCRLTPPRGHKSCASLATSSPDQVMVGRVRCARLHGGQVLIFRNA